MLELFEQVRLPDPGRCPGGTRTSCRAAWRSACASPGARGRPGVLIADEPTTALDVTVQAEILALLRQPAAETGMSIILVTHDWGVVADICDRAVVMYAGQIVEQARSGPVPRAASPLHARPAGM